MSSCECYGGRASEPATRGAATAPWGATMFDDLEHQMERGNKSSKKLLLYQAGGLLVALTIFALLGWAMMTYSG